MRGLGYATALTGLVVLTGAGAFVLAEPGKDYFDGVYWALQTVTKLGYGDQPITTTDGKVVTMLLMIAGVVYFAVLTGALAERFDQARRTGPRRGDRGRPGARWCRWCFATAAREGRGASAGRAVRSRRRAATRAGRLRWWRG